MANISEEISEVQAASRGNEVRGAIVSALNKINSDVLPDASASDSGKILCVNSSGEWVKDSLSGYMPIPTASKSIAQNGTYDVTNYAEAVVNVPSGGGGGGAVPFLYDVGEYFGDPEGSNTTSITVTYAEKVGTKVLLIVLHRDSISLSDNGFSLVSSTKNENHNSQRISVYEKYIDSVTGQNTVVITQQSAVRMCACTFYVDQELVLSQPVQQELDDYTTYRYTITPSRKIRLVVISNPYTGDSSCAITPLVRSLPNKLRDETARFNSGIRLAAFFTYQLSDNVVFTANSNVSAESTLYNRAFIYEVNFSSPSA